MRRLAGWALAVSLGMIGAAAAQSPVVSPEIQMRFQLGQALQLQATAEAQLAAMKAADAAKAAWWAGYVAGIGAKLALHPPVKK